LNNWQEWRSGTNPRNAVSLLRLLTPAISGSDLILTWESVQVAVISSNGPRLSPSESVRAAGQGHRWAGVHDDYTDGGALNAGSFFYRVGVE